MEKQDMYELLESFLRKEGLLEEKVDEGMGILQKVAARARMMKRSKKMEEPEEEVKEGLLQKLAQAARRYKAQRMAREKAKREKEELQEALELAPAEALQHAMVLGLLSFLMLRSFRGALYFFKLPKEEGRVFFSTRDRRLQGHFSMYPDRLHVQVDDLAYPGFYRQVAQAFTSFRQVLRRYFGEVTTNDERLARAMSRVGVEVKVQAEE